MMGQLHKERITPDNVFNKVGLDYAGPVYLKQGSVRKPVMVKAYVCVFVPGFSIIISNLTNLPQYII